MLVFNNVFVVKQQYMQSENSSLDLSGGFIAMYMKFKSQHHPINFHVNSWLTKELVIQFTLMLSVFLLFNCIKSAILILKYSIAEGRSSENVINVFHHCLFANNKSWRKADKKMFTFICNFLFQLATIQIRCLFYLLLLSSSWQFRDKSKKRNEQRYLFAILTCQMSTLLDSSFSKFKPGM